MKMKYIACIVHIQRHRKQIQLHYIDKKSIVKNCLQSNLMIILIILITDLKYNMLSVKYKINNIYIHFFTGTHKKILIHYDL